ncbi:MAG TPA: AI-2E family transporter [Bacteroidia bacterium]|jgi:predicted PurR-regulated permease PerM|nr:AI-2E family transporter [Bacteroidia bacterium]
MEINQPPYYIRITIKLLLGFLIFYILHVAQDVLIPLTVAVLLTFLLMPVSNKLIKWKFPPTIAILCSILLALVVVAGLFYFFYSQIVSFAEDLPLLQAKLLEKVEFLQHFVNETFRITKEQQNVLVKSKLQENIADSGLLLLDLFSSTGTFIANFALVTVYVFFLTLYKKKFKQFIEAIVMDGKHNSYFEIVKKVAGVSQNYLKGIFLDVLILSILNSTGFMLLGIEHAILFGVLASVLNIIPYIGVLIGSILPVLMALLTKDEIGYAIGAAGVCVTVQFIDNNFITPYVVGSSVSINPLTATIALIISASVWGLAGMVLCLPLTGMLKVVCDHVEGLKPIGFLIGEEVDYRKNKFKLGRK